MKRKRINIPGGTNGERKAKEKMMTIIIRNARASIAQRIRWRQTKK